MIYISKLFSPISTGTSAGDIDVGATVKINENGSPVDYIVVQQGLPGSMYDASCDGTWLLRKDIAENRVWDAGSVNDYANSDINSYLNGDWLNRYDADVSEKIVQCKIPHVNGTGGSAVASGANGLSVKAFLLGGYEVGWTKINNQYLPIDGSALSHFQNTSLTDPKRIAYLNGAVAYWWLRSPRSDNNNDVWRVDQVGFLAAPDSNGSYGIRPCIILPFTFKFKEAS